MKTVRLCFLWHMHQPLYVDRATGAAAMPWVRLHAIKAYFDMAFLLERFPAVKATFNFTPSLLLQLQDLAAGTSGDLFLEHAARPAADLTLAERAFILRHFFAANWDTMVRPWPRYHDLLLKRGTDIRKLDFERAARQFSTQELLDLQVWHNLAWFGFGAVARHPRLAELRLQDRGFTEADKREVLELQQRVIGEIVPLYRRLAEAGQIELTTTPFYHPILPLLIDSALASRARPEAALPRRFRAPEDAEAQLRRAVAFHHEVFGRPPAGLWPSEGAVCPELVPMVRRAGLRWLATDEGVLARSLEAAHCPWRRAEALYRPYTVGEPGEEVAILFRDRELSDAFGFVYAKTPPAAAVEDVLRRVEAAVRQAPGDQALVAVILDGENPWEHYPGGGEPFLTDLYRRLAEPPQRILHGAVLQTETVSRALDHHPPAARLERLHSGSWINADFGIWIGHPEDNRGWDYLRETRARLAEASPGLAPEQARNAWEELYAAEGSDWFWWYGDEFHSDYKAEFDRLFRTHLRNVFLRAGLPVPEFLSEPVLGAREPDAIRWPVSLLRPVIDGLVTDFFEWHGAGHIDPAAPLGAMWRGQPRFAAILFGFDLETLFLRLDPASDQAAGPAAVDIQIATETARHKLVFPLGPPGPDACTLWSAAPGGDWVEAGRIDTIRRQRVIELAVPFKVLDLSAGQELRLSLLVTQEGLEVERHPCHHPLRLRVPDRNFESIMWRV